MPHQSTLRSHSPRGIRQPGSTVAGLGLVLALLFASCGAAETGADAETPAEDGVLIQPHPGSSPYPPALRLQLIAALGSLGADYEPRTHHLTAEGRPRYVNRLILEDSPYLLQHAHNPVDWYPWGEEAFDRARAEGKVIFLSIGYSTCHWCHVMERESFEDAAIARILNEHFICIKIDRERRPDVDELYMTAVQLISGRGGWPMSSFLTPEGEPFFGGTYFPPKRFATLLKQVNASWHSQRDQLVQQAAKVAGAMERATAARGEAREVGRAAIDSAASQLLESFDAELGGFGKAPKFPHEPELLFLLDRGARLGDAEAIRAADSSLEAMASGGIYDQVGGGFHRYSVDAQWLVPHFEKMLYNQAHLGRAYLTAHRLSGDPHHARTARETLDYVLREMTSPAGAFYSATDADSEGKEGEFFVWTPAELAEALREEDAKLASELWGVTEEGNFEGKNILHLPRSLSDFAAEKGLDLEDLLKRVDRIRETLWQAREEREHPLRDDKVITAWNGMMITTFAEASEILDDERYLAAARRAADFVWRENRRGPGDYWRIHLTGSSSIPALQEDHAYLAEALLTLYDVTGEASWLAKAREVTDAMLERFWDDEHGGFFMTAKGTDHNLVARPKSPNDGAIPSGNSVATRVLARLAARTQGTVYGDRASATVNAFADSIERYPSGFAYLLMATDELLNGPVGPRQYGGSGTVRATGELIPKGDGAELGVALEIAEGWHVNAHRPLSGELIPTVLSLADDDDGWQLSGVAYPAAEQVSLGFQKEPLSVYHGTVRLAGEVRRGADQERAKNLVARLQIQACNDRVCLLPETLALELPAHAVP